MKGYCFDTNDVPWEGKFIITMLPHANIWCKCASRYKINVIFMKKTWMGILMEQNTLVPSLFLKFYLICFV